MYHKVKSYSQHFVTAGAVKFYIRVHCGHFSADSCLSLYCQSEWYNIHMLVYVSYALILGLKDEPYDDIIIVHVLFL